MDTNKYKNELLKEKAKLTSLIGEMQDNTVFGNTSEHTSERYTSGELSSYDNHIADMATDVFMQDMQNSLTNHEKGKLFNVEVALSKIENGTYGICDHCKKQIDEDRLDILPETGLCSNCANNNDSVLTDTTHPDTNIINNQDGFNSGVLRELTNMNKTDRSIEY